MTKNVALQILEEKVSEAVGVVIEITIRGTYDYTVSTETIVPDLQERVERFFGKAIVSSSVVHDEETGSFVYLSVKQ